MSAAGSDTRPRVLHVAPDAPGGMTAVRRELFASSLADRYRFDIVNTHRGTGAARRLVVYSLGLLRVAWWSLRRRGRIVHVHSTVRGSMYRKALVVPLAKALGRRVVLHIHSGPGDVISFRERLGSRGAAVLRFCLARADAVLSVSVPSAAELEKAFGLSIEVLPNPAPPVSATPAAGREGLLAIFLGGFENPVKGGAEILEALELIEPSELKVVLAGPGEIPPDGRRLVESRPDVEWRGWLAGEEREDVMGSASIFVLSSSSEGLPIALLEAMSLGMAIAATEVGGVPDVVDDGVEALLVAPKDPGALAGALARIAADDELRERLGRAAQVRAAGMGIERVAERIDALYQELLSPSRGRSA
ncbi:MAG: glycosyltransferase family 4 protein [Solirubrobacterales bacterium]